MHINTVLPLPDENMYRMNRKAGSAATADPLGKSRTRAPKNESWWRNENSGASQTFFTVLSSLEQWLEGEGFNLEANWTAQSYVGYWAGSRCVIAAWPQKASAAIYLPDPAGDGTLENPSSFYTELSAKLSAVGHKVSWAPTYNALANPIRLVLKLGSVAYPQVAEAIRDSLKGHHPSTKSGEPQPSTT